MMMQQDMLCGFHVSVAMTDSQQSCQTDPSCKALLLLLCAPNRTTTLQRSPKIQQVKLPLGVDTVIGLMNLEGSLEGVCQPELVQKGHSGQADRQRAQIHAPTQIQGLQAGELRHLKRCYDNSCNQAKASWWI